MFSSFLPRKWYYAFYLFIYTQILPSGRGAPRKVAGSLNAVARVQGFIESPAFIQHQKFPTAELQHLKLKKDLCPRYGVAALVNQAAPIPWERRPDLHHSVILILMTPGNTRNRMLSIDDPAENKYLPSLVVFGVAT